MTECSIQGSLDHDTCDQAQPTDRVDWQVAHIDTVGVCLFVTDFVGRRFERAGQQDWRQAAASVCSLGSCHRVCIIE